MAELEKLTDYFGTTEERLNAEMFGPNALVEGLIAFVGGTVAGFSLFYPSFSSFRGEMGLHIEDLLIRQIARIAASRGLFHVPEWNAGTHGTGGTLFFCDSGYAPRCAETATPFRPSHPKEYEAMPPLRSRSDQMIIAVVFKPREW